MSHAVSQRYSKALMALAENDADVAKFRDDLNGLNKVFSESADALRIISNPKVRKAEKTALVSEIASRGGCHPMVVNLLKLMATKNRLEIFPDLCRHFEKLALEALGIAKATFVFATPPDPETQSKLCATLGKVVGKKIIPSYVTDPAILDGAIVKVGSLEIDGSVRNHFKRIRDKIEKLNINHT